MPLRLERALKREIDLGGAPYTVTVSPLGVRLVRKGFRKGVAVSWRRLLALAAGEGAGDAARDAGHDAPHNAPRDAPAGDAVRPGSAREPLPPP